MTDKQEATTVKLPVAGLSEAEEIERLWRAVGMIRAAPEQILDKMRRAYVREQQRAQGLD